MVRRYVAVSQDLSDWLVRDIGIPRGRIAAIYNGVDTARFCPAASGRGVLPAGFAPDDAVVVGTIGRLEQVKDQTTLAAAFCRVIRDRPELRRRLRLVVIGDGSLRGEIERLLAEHDAPALAWLPGYSYDAPELLRAFDVFALPSRREGISNTVLEAMATAKPVVATAVGGNPEIVVDGVTGLLTPPADPAAMAERLAHYVDDPALAAAHGQAGLDRIRERFSLAAMVSAYLGVYDEVAPK